MKGFQDHSLANYMKQAKQTCKFHTSHAQSTDFRRWNKRGAQAVGVAAPQDFT
jgi:hypothetical protein